MDIRIAGIQDDSVVDGEGIRLTVFGQGCPHHCKGCHNPQTWSEDGGYMTTTDKIMDIYKANILLDGITFSVGEPFAQAEAFTKLARAVHEAGGTVWCYTGYTLERLKNSRNFYWIQFLNHIDVLVDGPFVESLKDLTLQFRGSSNQNIYRKRGMSGWDLWVPEGQSNVA